MEIFRGVQVTKPTCLHCNTIINLVIFSFGFVNHAIYHALYTLYANSTNEFLIFLWSTNEFMCAYSSIWLLKDLLSGINKYLLVTSKESPELSYLNLRIVKSPYGISIDQTSHIQDTIYSQWSPYAYENSTLLPIPSRHISPLNFSSGHPTG